MSLAPPSRGDHVVLREVAIFHSQGLRLLLDQHVRLVRTQDDTAPRGIKETVTINQEMPRSRVRGHYSSKYNQRIFSLKYYTYN